MMSDIHEINVSTGQEIFRSYTQEELDYIEIISQQEQDPSIPTAADSEAQQALKNSALQKLISLGLTEEEAKAIISI